MENKITINELRQIVRSIINEGMGIPNIIKSVVNKSETYFNEIDNFKRYDNYTESKLNINGDDLVDSFFDHLIIIVKTYDADNLNLNSFYIPKLSEWNDKDNKFYILNITISLSKNNLNLFNEKLTHELLHAYEDYNRALKGKGFNNLDQERITVNSDGLEKINRYMVGNLEPIKSIIYFNLDTEKRANIAQFYSELKKYNIDINDIKNNKYKNISTYKIYQNIYNSVDNILNKLNTNEINILIDYCLIMKLNNIVNRSESETISENEFKTRFIKYIKTGANNTMSKMDKIVWEYINDKNNDKQ